MFDEFQSDLRIVRERSGLTQAEAGHLIGTGPDTLGKIERGERMPSLKEMLGLSILFGKSFESFFEEILALVRAEMAEALSSLPGVAEVADGSDRADTLSTLAKRLDEEHAATYGT